MRPRALVPIAGLALLCLAGCNDGPTQGRSFSISSHWLMASAGAAQDTIACQLSGSLPLPDSIQAWSGTADLHLSRRRVPGTAATTGDTTLVAAAVSVVPGAGDTVRVHVRAGGVAIDFTGRKLYRYEAEGTWQCDETVPLARVAPGRASGAWYLMSSLPID